MIALQPPSAASASTPASLNLPARLAAATEALIKTREQVVAALDQHLRELDTLRRSLGQPDKPLLSAVPVLPTLPAIPEPAPAARYFERQPEAQPAAVAPLMTQVMWPSKNQPTAAPAFAASPSPMSSFAATQAGFGREAGVDPDLEKATLEELNAALAHAFSHVSSGRAAPAQPQQPGPVPMPAGSSAAWGQSGRPA